MINDSLAEKTVNHLSRVISTALKQHKSVLWLISGGSAIEVAIEAKALIGPLPPGLKLHVGLVDERFGLVGHKNSNLKQLLDSGFDASDITVHPILLAGKTIKECADAYNQTLEQLISSCGNTIGLFGMGADGHTAGILPSSPLLNEKRRLVGYYKAVDFERISITPLLINKLDEAILYAKGENKWPALKQLQEDGPSSDIPARILKTAKVFTLYTDYKGAKI